MRTLLVLQLCLMSCNPACAGSQVTPQATAATQVAAAVACLPTAVGQIIACLSAHDHPCVVAAAAALVVCWVTHQAPPAPPAPTSAAHGEQVLSVDDFVQGRLQTGEDGVVFRPPHRATGRASVATETVDDVEGERFRLRLSRLESERPRRQTGPCTLPASRGVRVARAVAVSAVQKHAILDLNAHVPDDHVPDAGGRPACVSERRLARHDLHRWLATPELAIRGLYPQREVHTPGPLLYDHIGEEFHAPAPYAQ